MNREFTFINLGITDQDCNTITNGPGMAIVLHICDCFFLSYFEMECGKKLNPARSLRMAPGIKGTKQKIIVTHNPSVTDQNQLLEVRFPKLDRNDVIIPGRAYLSFSIKLSSKVDKNRTLVSNIGRALLKKLAVKSEANEILSVDDYDVFACY